MNPDKEKMTKEERSWQNRVVRHIILCQEADSTLTNQVRNAS